jgi:hypothetical protein
VANPVDNHSRFISNRCPAQAQHAAVTQSDGPAGNK